MKIAKILACSVVVLIAVVASLNGTESVAQEKHERAAVHNDAAMKKAEQAIAESLKTLSPADQKLVNSQRFCPMMPHGRLGAMGTPIKLRIGDKPVFVCCEECIAQVKKDSAGALKLAAKLIAASAELAKLDPAERTAIEAQKYCAIASGSILGSMGAPIKMQLDGQPVYLCCAGCTQKARSNPAATLAAVEELKKAAIQHGQNLAGHATRSNQ